MSKSAKPAVIVTGPPWPRSGTGRVMQSQIQHYRERGYETFFIAVPFRWNFTRTGPVWDEFRDGLYELGADHTLFAAIEPRKFTVAKYAATLRYRRSGTALDWLVAIGRSVQLTAEDKRLLKGLSVSLLHVNHVFTLGFALKLRNQLLRDGKQIPIVFDSHDVQSHMLEEKKELNPWTKRPDPIDQLLNAEVDHLRAPDALVHLSVNDFKFFADRLPTKKHFLAFPTMDSNFVASVKSVSEKIDPIDLLFVAHWHHPNLLAIQWLFDHVWPFLVGHGYKLKIVGRIDRLVEGQAPLIHEQHRDCFVGEVVDLAPYYEAARCVIAPMVSGSGISIKTIEAFALGKAFVGTSKAFRGMPMERLEALGIRSFDQPQSFAEAVVSTLNDPSSSERASQVAFDSLFSTEACFSIRDEAVAAARQQVSPKTVLAR